MSRLDLSYCQNHTDDHEIIPLLLSILAGKRPGPNEISSVVYKMAARWLVDVFREALAQLCNPYQRVPISFHSVLWIPMRKVPNPTCLLQIRDIELANGGRFPRS